MCMRHKGAAAMQVVNPYRLPRTVIPDSYQLKLIPDLAAARFSGEVTIRVRVLEPVTEIVLNALDLEIQEALVRKGNGTAFNGTVSLDKETERAIIKVNGTIGTGDWQVKLRFTGELNDKLKGWYRSVYNDESGAEQVIATTQFESTDARRAFPCFDEPDMKATFQITLVVDENLSAVSNGKVVSVKKTAGGKKIVEFAPTMKMSTYIVAFVVGKLNPTKPVNVDGVDIRMWTVPGREHLATFALESAQFSLRYFKRYFGVAYPGDKLDLLAIPDFAAGAMENLGCVTFREEVLVDPARSSQSALDWVAEVVAHELAHMWFGNLVTMKWWNGLWLNEAFATFMSYKAVDAWKSDWQVWNKFGLSRGTAMRTDGLKSTRPIEFPVNHPDDAQAMFDVLTYEKGCSVMRMLEQYVGEDKFQQGIAAYIKAHSYDNTETADLWGALEEATGMPVTEIMHGWIFKSGYPVISVTESDKAGCVVLSQQAFKFLPDAVDHQQLWSIPVMLRVKTAEGTQDMKVLLSEKEQTIYLGEKLEWVVANAGGHGFYRVLYTPTLGNKLTVNVHENLSVIERVNMVSDNWSCVRAGMARAVGFVELVKLFDEEPDPNVWAVILGPLGAIRDLLPESHRPQLEKLVYGLLKPTMDKLGWQPSEGESSQIRELRASIISAMGHTAKDAMVTRKARELYDAYKQDPDGLDGNIVSTVISLVAVDGDNDLYDEFYTSFKGAKTPEDEQRFLFALTGFRNLDLAKRTLECTLDPTKIRTQDAPSVVSSLMRNEVAGQTAWDFVKTNWEKMNKLYPESGIVGMCGGVTALSTPEQEADVIDFFATHKVKTGEKRIPQYLEMLRIAVLLRQRESDALAAAFLPPVTQTPTTVDGSADGETPADTSAQPPAADAPRQPDAIRDPLPGDPRNA
jgi:puromycin-sensitive aminopeptidase